MRLSLSAHLVLGIAALYVLGSMALHYRGCTYRLKRACRLYGAGRIVEADRVVAAVGRSRAVYKSRHPQWTLAADRAREMPS